MTALSDLLRVDRSAQVELAVRIRPRNRETGETVLVLLTTQSGGILSEPTDSPPNAPYLERLLRGWNLELRLTQPGQLLAGAGATSFGTLLVDDSRQEFATWPDYDWSAAEIDIRAGGKVGADGRRFPLAEFEPLFAGLVSKFRRGSEDSSWEISIRGPKRRADLPLVTDTFRGFGGALRIDDNASWLEAADDAPLLTGGARTIEWVGVIPALPASEMFLWDQDGRFTLALLADGSLRMQLLSGMTVLDEVASAAGVVVPEAGRPRFFALVVDPGDTPATPTVRLLYGTIPDDFAEVVSGALSGAINDTGSAVLRLGAGSAAGAALWEVRISDVAYGLDELAARIFSPAPDLADAALVEAWQFDDAGGTTAYGAKGVLNLPFGGGQNLTWVASLDGDDPVTFGGGPIGQTKPDGWGSAFGVALPLVDSPRGTYLAGPAGATEDVLRVFLDAAPMAPDETLLAANSGDIVFTAPNVVTLTGGLTAHRLIPTQTVDPARAGQFVDVTGTALNDLSTVEVAYVAADGLSLGLVATVVNETAPPGAMIRTSEADRQYTYDLASSTIATPVPVQGSLTAWWKYRSGTSGLALYSEALAYVLNAPVDTSALVWDPPVAFPVAAGDASTGRQFAAQLALSAVAWLLERPDGTFATGTLQPPTAAEVVGLITPGTNVSISPLEFTDPFRQITVAWGRTWQTVDRGSMAGSLTNTDRDRHANSWRFEPKTATPAVLRKFPLAEVRLEPFETFLVARADALRWLELAAPLYLEERRWYSVENSGLGALMILPGSVYEIEHPDHTLQLPSGTLARIMTSGIDSSSDLVALEALV